MGRPNPVVIWVSICCPILVVTNPSSSLFLDTVVEDLDEMVEDLGM